MHNLAILAISDLIWPYFSQWVIDRLRFGGLIGIFEYGYSTVWKFGHFPGTLILREITLG